MAKILVIEDDASYCDSLAIVLLRAGHEVCVAQSSHQGVRKGIAHGPDLVITDWMLKSDLHGGQVAEQVRAVHPGVKIIVITGYRDVARQVKESYPFVSEVVQKPFHGTEILEVVERVLAQEDKSA
jgi:two-component system, NtrC family, response regulator HydG